MKELISPLFENVAVKSFLNLVPLGIENAARVSLDLVNADIHGVLRFFAQTSGLNIVAGDDVMGRVTVQFTDIPWDQALQAVLLSQGLRAVWVDSQVIQIRSL